MKFIKTKFFNSQVLELLKKYKKINADILFFENKIGQISNYFDNKIIFKLLI